MKSETHQRFGLAFYLAGVVLILLATAAHKLYVLYDITALRLAPDPLFFFLSNQVLWSVAASLELMVCVTIMVTKATKLKLILVLWLASAFLLYRLGLVATGYEGGCLCLGKPESWITVLGKRFHQDILLKIALAYMLLGSIWYLRMDLIKTLQVLTARRAKSAST